MFELKRAKCVCEKIKLGDEIITVKLDPGKIAVEYTRSCAELARAEKTLDTPGGLEEYGRTVIRFYELIFGAETAHRIFEFYENDYFEMCLQTLPFITETILPRITSALGHLKSGLKKSYLKGAGGGAYGSGNSAGLY